MMNIFGSTQSIRWESVASPNVQSNSDKKAYSNELKYVLKGMAAEKDVFQSCEIWKTPLNIQEHPVFARGTVLPTLPGFIQACSTTFNIFALEKITLSAVLQALAEQASIPGGLMLLSSAGAIYLFYKGVKILLQHHMVILRARNTKIFLEFHADGLSIIVGDAVKIPPYPNKDCVMIQQARRVVCPLAVLEQIEATKDRGYRVLSWNCQHFARDVFRLFGQPHELAQTEYNVRSIVKRLGELYSEKSEVLSNKINRVPVKEILQNLKIKQWLERLRPSL